MRAGLSTLRELKLVLENAGAESWDELLKYEVRNFLEVKVPADHFPFSPPVTFVNQCENAPKYGDAGSDEDLCDPDHPFHWSQTCEACFQSGLAEIRELPRASRTPEVMSDFYHEYRSRFKADWDQLDVAYSSMLQALHGRWVHYGNLDEVIDDLFNTGLPAGMDYRERITADDKNLLSSELMIPAYDPEAKNEPSKSGIIAGLGISIGGLILGFAGAWGLGGGLIWVGIGVGIWMGQRHARWEKLREASYVPAWQPQDLLAFYKVEDDKFRQTIWYLARFLTFRKLWEAGESSEPNEWAASTGNRWNPLGPLPSLPDRDITPREAEEYVCRVISYLGDPQASVTRYVADGGVDVISENFAVQVKHEVANVGPNIVRQIFGVATSKGKKASVFARNGFTAAAIEFANNNDILLFSYQSGLIAHSQTASNALKVGLRVDD